MPALDAYRLWAPSYDAETVVSELENQLVSAMTPKLAGKRLLDAGCGTGRRLAATDAATKVGIDISREMIDAGGCEGLRSGTTTIVGDIRALPVADRSFDVVWSRLAIGHLPDCAPVYAELARVADHHATIIVSDFHPAAASAGHRRRFRLGDQVHEIEHHLHDVGDHVAAAAAAGLGCEDVREAGVGPAVRSFYERALMLDRYEQDLGLPLVLALAFRRAK